MRKLTTTEFIEKAKAVHGDKYDYSKTEYKGNRIKVCIICPEHGEFWQSPKNHVQRKAGCPRCFFFNKGTHFAGGGRNDMEYITHDIQIYDIWCKMLSRCYDAETQRKTPTYTTVSVCAEWLTFSNFQKWYKDNYKEGYEIDKDLLSEGLKIYSPTTCCFIPKYINAIVASIRKNIRGYTERDGRFYASVQKYGKKVNLGGYATPEEAHAVYVLEKKHYIKEVAEISLANGEIDERVFNAILKYSQKIE